MAESTGATPEIQQPSTTESTRHQERYVRPPVDIYETQEGLVVLADLPGVTKEALDVRVDHNVLTIRGHARHGVPGEAVYREYALVNFFRQFTLSEHVDQRQITAELKRGVLTVTLPKAEAAKPRQIAVQAA
jgi:HSP20 family molecular chaperone IbpA